MSLTRAVMHAYYQRDVEAIQRLCEGAEIRERSQERRINALADALAHGDQAHQTWIRDAVKAHFSGRPIPPMA